jgi:hypothetical protein
MHSKMLVEIPLNPFPSIIAPMYLNGSIPPNPNTLDYKHPLNTPKVRSSTMQSMNAGVGSKY